MRKLAIDVPTDEEIERLFNILKKEIIKRQAKLLKETKEMEEKSPKKFL